MVIIKKPSQRSLYFQYVFLIALTIISSVISFAFFLSLFDITLFKSNRQIFFENEYVNPTKDRTLFYDFNYENKTRENGAIVVLVRNEELSSLMSSMRQFEDRFNKKFQYPYVFLNDKEFTKEFIESTKAMTNAETKYGLIPVEMWSYPSWINQTEALYARKKMEEDKVIYGGSESYRHMCRFNSGFFFRHPLIEQYDYYWRLEPGVEFMCDIDYDVFKFIKKNNITYGFTIALMEVKETIPTLWDTVKEFTKEYPEYMNKNSAMKFISNTGKNYNMCHFWSNFEIGDLNFWRSEKYIKFFEYLDKAGGFFYERWGDAPVHTIALALFLEKNQIHFFNDISYRHDPFEHCPIEKDVHEGGKCHCNPEKTFGKNLF
ncbi:Glycosyltransferase Family 15 protein [Rhizophagus diaphanus]|nr:Glycosyltransferase Family 15 protein [Rhizophagus diaphanus] [Rhizophagus sp. MUCL 43196]